MVKCSPPDPSPARRNNVCPTPRGGKNLELGPAEVVQGSCAWVLALGTICHLSSPPYFHLLEPELLKPHPPIPLLTLGTSHPARGDVISPSPVAPSPEVFPHNFPLQVPSGVQSVALQRLLGPPPLAVDRGEQGCVGSWTLLTIPC